jgi:hypothetical protein
MRVKMRPALATAFSLLLMGCGADRAQGLLRPDGEIAVHIHFARGGDVFEGIRPGTKYYDTLRARLPANRTGDWVELPFSLVTPPKPAPRAASIN